MNMFVWSFELKWHVYFFINEFDHNLFDYLLNQTSNQVQQKLTILFQINELTFICQFWHNKASNA
jgi:hypothetical protein